MFFVMSLVASSSWADLVGEVKDGNAAYGKGDFKTALEHYHAAEASAPESPELQYNLGNAYHGQEKYETAVEMFQKALKSTDPMQQAAAHYNLGNTHYKMGDYLKAIAGYEEALKLNPTDTDAKFNLELARKMLKEHAKPDQQNQQNNQNQQQSQQNQQDQQDQNKQDSTENQQNQPDSAQDKQQQQQQQQAEQRKDQKMSKEDAERILNALRDDERDVQKKIRRDVNAADYTGKDW
jgi:tetratricopeptide (TPR) repeat protein